MSFGALKGAYKLKCIIIIIITKWQKIENNSYIFKQLFVSNHKNVKFTIMCDKEKQ